MVRNITGCPVAGLDANEICDPSPLAIEASRLLAGNAEFYNLPRKFKVSLTGCRDWCSYPEINDVGLTAVTRTFRGESETGFSLRVGGGVKFTFGNLPSIGWREPTGRLVELAQRAESAGFDRFGVSDWRFYQDCFVVMTACLQATNRLEVESLVTDPYVRHPSLTAVALATMDELSNGRAIMGIGGGIEQPAARDGAALPRGRCTRPPP